MGNNWNQYALSDLIVLIGGGTPRRDEPKYWGGDIPWLSVKDFNNDQRRVCSARECITQLGLENSNTHVLQPGQIVISARGTVGALAQLAQPMSFNQSCYGIDGKPELVINDFLYYLLKNAIGDLKRITHGAVFDTITQDTFKHISVSVPSLSTQRLIARSLGSLDDKIELNRHMNETLEALVRSLFESWFVNFDPVRAKAAGRQPMGMDAEMVALFPDTFDETELGNIPIGWRVGSILEFADLIGGGTPKTSIPDYWNGDIPWVSAKDVSNASGLFLLTTEKTISQEGLSNSSTRLLPAKTTIVTARGTVGACCLLGREMTMNQTNYGLRAKEIGGDYFVYFSLVTLVEQLRQHSYGTIFDTITTKTFNDTLSIQPPQTLIKRFESEVEPVMSAILNNQQQSRTLVALRDALMPKLLSGDVPVKEEA